ncbi:MAG: HD domain-containing protein, partial [Deltaproteobacteria bacterium]
KSLALPSWTQCLELLDAHGMLPNIREHSFAVLQVARYLGDALTDAGFNLSLPLVEVGALLHDIGKTACLGTMNNHAEYGAEILEELGYPQVAQVVREHVHLFADIVDARPVREAELVNYADKRVLHDEVVTLEARFADLKVRYGRTPEALARIQATEIRARALEDKLFAPLALTPAELLHLNHCRRTSWENCDWPSLPGANPRSGKSL